MQLLAALVCAAGSGCALLPDRVVEPQIHNPFPQLHRVAVLPFYNQSAEPTVDGEAVALAYYNELQAIPGFEVMPVGVARQLLAASGLHPRHGAEFQQLARLMGVDAVVVGSITEYSPYYPPRMGLAVNWYAANPGFHPIPPGYGLPWGRAEEEFIPSPLVREAEFALARQQLATQTPAVPPEIWHGAKGSGVLGGNRVSNMEDDPPPKTPDPLALQPPEPLPAPDKPLQAMPPASAAITDAQPKGSGVFGGNGLPMMDDAFPPKTPHPFRGDPAVAGTASAPLATGLPPDWPDPRGFVPPPPSAHRPILRSQHEPIITHTRIFHGQDAKFTERLATYYYLRDDARFGGWSGYLQRPDDFVRFCCHLHVTETLAARGGAGEARVLWRWPISRYER